MEKENQEIKEQGNEKAGIENTKENKEEFNGSECEVYSRVVGYLRPISQWNEGKVSEFRDRKNFEVA
jgi:anaerobic ribonucleoside-triphosphate reductase